MKPAIAIIDDKLELHIQRLLNCWRDETAFLSSSTAITNHPAYVELIAIGSDALPALFRDLDKSHDGHLSKALTAITGANPILDEERGYIRKVATAWLRWATENGYR